jgi:hypothetical protein
MNFFPLTIISIFSFILTFIGVKYLYPFLNTNLNDIGVVLSNSFNVIASGTPETFKLIFAVLVTLFGLFLSVIVIYNWFSIFTNIPSSLILQKSAIALFILLLFLNVLISIYVLLFIVLLIIVFTAFIYFLFSALTTGSSYSTRGGSVQVKGHYRKGSYVKSHTRKRPRNF